jgi:hypothetical protein
VRGKNDRRITIGARGSVEAAGERRARAPLHSAWRKGVRAGAFDCARAREAANGSTRPWEITDNSFLVEEAFNQEAGVVQNIFGIVAPGDGSWAAAFTQEWPMRVHAHQFSYTVALARVDHGTGIGDALLNYRFQAVG